MKLALITTFILFSFTFFLVDTAATCNDDRTNKPHHTEAGLECKQCHAVEKPDSAPIGDFFCRKCHNLEELITRTETDIVYKSSKVNPHKTPHGELAGCVFCHREHSKSRFYCAGCHSFTMETP